MWLVWYNWALRNALMLMDSSLSRTSWLEILLYLWMPMIMHSDLVWNCPYWCAGSMESTFHNHTDVWGEHQLCVSWVLWTQLPAKRSLRMSFFPGLHFGKQLPEVEYRTIAFILDVHTQEALIPERWYWVDWSFAVLKACLVSLWHLGWWRTLWMLSLAWTRQWSVLHFVLCIALVVRTLLLSCWRVMIKSMRCHCLDWKCIHVFLYLSACLKTVFMISSSCSAHLFSSRCLLLSLITPLCSLLLFPTLVLKSPRRMSMSMAGVVHSRMSRLV